MADSHAEVRRDAEEAPIVTERITDDDCPCLKPSHRDLEARLEQAERERDAVYELDERKEWERAEMWREKANALAASVPALVEALKRISEWQPAVLETLRANGIVFRTALDKPDDERTDAERWEKVAFSIYTDLCEVDTQARAALTVYEQSQGNTE